MDVILTSLSYLFNPRSPVGQGYIFFYKCIFWKFIRKETPPPTHIHTYIHWHRYNVYNVYNHLGWFYKFYLGFNLDITGWTPYQKLDVAKLVNFSYWSKWCFWACYPPPHTHMCYLKYIIINTLFKPKIHFHTWFSGCNEI